MVIVFLVIRDVGVVPIALALHVAPAAGIRGLRSRALRIDREQRDQPLEVVALARGAFRCVRIEDQLLEPVSAGSTFVFIDWHSEHPAVFARSRRPGPPLIISATGYDANRISPAGA